MLTVRHIKLLLANKQFSMKGESVLHSEGKLFIGRQIDVLWSDLSALSQN